MERRAFKQAVFAVKDDEVALDIVQDAMLRLAEKYSAQDIAELPMLFQRILQNAIRDWFRRSKVRATHLTPFSSFSGNDDEGDGDEFNILESLEADDTANVPTAPGAQLEQAQLVRLIEEAVANLPARQREAFVLRYWEEFDVAEAAEAMGCSEGSVKTHCSRAIAALAAALRAKGISLSSIPRMSQ